MQFGKFDRIAPVGLDPLAWSLRDQRWRHHHTVVLDAGELSLNTAAARAGAVARPQILSSSG
jgi:hypothetical protein